MFISTLILLPILCLFFVLYVDTYGNRTRDLASRFSDMLHAALQTAIFHPQRRRRVNWITRNDLPGILERSEDVLLLDLRSRGDLDPLPLFGSQVWQISPEHLNDLLPWLPSETSIVLCGTPDVCSALLRGLSDASGSATIYVLAVNRTAVRLQPRLVPVVITLLGLAVATTIVRGQSSSSSVAPGQDLLIRTQGSGQNNGRYENSGYKRYPEHSQSLFHHLAIEAGVGFDAPVGNTSDRQTFGYNIKLGGGWNFSQRFGALIEYEFNRSGIPNAVLTAAGAPDGNVHIWGFTVDPIYYVKNNGGWGGYVTGGYGFYRRLTSFTQPVNLGYGCDFYGYCYPQYGNQTLSHFSSNQGGGSIGGGLTHSLGEGGAKVYVETRYLYVAAPSKSSSTQSGSGYSATNMIAVTFGIRF